MNTKSNLKSKGNVYLKAFITGSGISLLITSAYILSVQYPKASWGTYWQIRPLIVGPLIAGLGMLTTFLILKYLSSRQVSKVFAYPFAVLIFILSLWISMVLGFKGTLWN